MRILILGVLAASLATGACGGENASTTPPADGAALTAAPPAATGDPNTAPVATAGTDTPRAVTPIAPVWREVTIPAGTSLPVVLDTTVGSATSHAEEPVNAHLSRAITIDGQTVLGEGSRVSGVVTDATPSAKVKGRAHVALRFDSLTPKGGDERYDIRTSSVGRTAPATKKEDALKIGVPAAGGAVIGAIVGGKKGAAIGGAVGGGGGTAVVMSTRGKEVSLPRGAALTLKLTEPLTVKIRG